MNTDIVINQPTITEIKAYLEERKDAEFDPVGDLLFEDCSVADVVFLTSLKNEEIDAMTPSEVQPIVDAAREANPAFFEMNERARSVMTDLFSGLLKDIDRDS